MPSFQTNVRFEQKITGIHKIHLSLSQFVPPEKKELAGPRGHTKASRLTVKEHLKKMLMEKRILDCNRPFMVLSVRNALANLRCVAWLKDHTPTPISVSEEYGILFKSRPYYLFGEKKGKLVIEKWDPKSWDPDAGLNFSWFVSGPPVLWDDADKDTLFRMIVPEAADHSHVWRLPRGSHPDATDKTRDQWKSLQKIFMENMTASPESAFEALNGYAVENDLQREDGYLHNMIGLDGEGNLCQLVASGRLEDLGRQMGDRGVKRALCLDNSGSITAQFFHEGIAGAVAGEYRCLVAAPNHRSPGAAYLIVELQDHTFK
ncbi:conserved hypothetical protein [Candidatus Desulfarcum epimagneticum]|uniref:Uncharacterized protein n=1 Tax=uncultured Desulfobacteraceae bacterium TaxID=218296 RepID=A0A484HKI2_9BACT|nr:conserved hypothetical protein [uncultured Desulfobacteraceae bacterium]